MKTKKIIFQYLRKITSFWHPKEGILFLAVLCALSSVSAQEMVGKVSDFESVLKKGFQSSAMQAESKLSIKATGENYLPVSVKSVTQTTNGEVITGNVAGKKSHVFFTFKDDEVSGKIVLSSEKVSFDYTSKNGVVYVKEEKTDQVICVNYETVKAEENLAIGSLAPPPTSTVYNLQSLPGAEAVVMLDFDGHTTTGSWWGTIDAQPSSASEEDIIGAFNLISEDFSPFELNITTNEAVYQNAPSNRRMRVIFTPTNDAAPGTGGVAFIGTFTTGGELAPCWVFNSGSGKIYGETASHEIGHTMGLLHDGRDFPDSHREEYYGGQGTWAPIMGVSYYREVSHWSIGEYQYGNNFENDINVIGSQNGFGFIPDIQGGTIATSSPLVESNGVVSADQNTGIISDNNDIDMFSFTTPGGNLNLTISQASSFPDLNVHATLLNSSGNIISTSDPLGISAAVFNLNLTAGQYYFAVKGTGEGDPFTDGYSSYSSIGKYSISGEIVSDTQNCHEFITQLPDGDVRFSVTYPVQKAYVEIFARKNGVQHLAADITGSMISNGNGTFTYSYTIPANFYMSGDVILTRFYSYSAGGPGIFTPGPSEGVWSEPFVYNEDPCDNENPVSNCKDMIQQLPNGDIKYLISYTTPQAYVELFSRTNGAQNLAINIVNSEVQNADGTYSYTYMVPASGFVTGDRIEARFYSYTPGGPGVFTPGPAESNWSASFYYNYSSCNSCEDIYESNNSMNQAFQIPVNSIIAAKIPDAYDTDWFKITTTNASPNVHITLTNLSVDFDMELYDGNGNYLAGSYYGGGYNETITYFSGSGSDYFIRIYGYLGYSSSQCYRLNVNTSSNSVTFSEQIPANQFKAGSYLYQQGNLISCYPNPATKNQQLIIQSKDFESGQRQIQIKDLNGKSVFEQECIFVDFATTILLPDIEKGMYIIDFGSDKKEKLVIE